MALTTAFFEDPNYVRTIAAEKTRAASVAQAHGAARLARCVPGSAVLDAGCGTGRHSWPLAGAGYRVAGLDSSRTLLAAARGPTRVGVRPRFVRGSCSELPFGAGSFDAVLCLGTALGYLGEAADRAALREFRRVLVSGGRLVVETLHSDEIGARLTEHEERPLPSGGVLRFTRRFDRARSVMREAQSLENGTGDGMPRTYELRVYGERELRRMLEDAGFAITGCYASLAEGRGEATPFTPLVLVAEPERGRARFSFRRAC